MSEFLTTGVADNKAAGPPAEGNIFSGSQWGSPETWDGPVWSEKYHKYVTQKDKDFDDAAEEVAKRRAHEHNDELHKQECPCSIPNHHASYVGDIKRRIEPLVETVNQLERQVGQMSQSVAKGDQSHHEENHRAIEHTVSSLKGHLHDIAQKMHAIIKNAEHGVKNLGGIDQGSKDEVEHIYRTSQPK